jgi:hypothetical protein
MSKSENSKKSDKIELLAQRLEPHGVCVASVLTLLRSNLRSGSIDSANWAAAQLLQNDMHIILYRKLKQFLITEIGVAEPRALATWPHVEAHWKELQKPSAVQSSKQDMNCLLLGLVSAMCMELKKSRMVPNGCEFAMGELLYDRHPDYDHGSEQPQFPQECLSAVHAAMHEGINCNDDSTRRRTIICCLARQIVGHHFHDAALLVMMCRLLEPQHHLYEQGTPRDLPGIVQQLFRLFEQLLLRHETHRSAICALRQLYYEAPHRRSADRCIMAALLICASHFFIHPGSSEYKEMPCFRCLSEEEMNHIMHDGYAIESKIAQPSSPAECHYYYAETFKANERKQAMITTHNSDIFFQRTIERCQQQQILSLKEERNVVRSKPCSVFPAEPGISSTTDLSEDQKEKLKSPKRKVSELFTAPSPPPPPIQKPEPLQSSSAIVVTIEDDDDDDDADDATQLLSMSSEMPPDEQEQPPPPSKRPCHNKSSDTSMKPTIVVDDHVDLEEFDKILHDDDDQDDNDIQLVRARERAIAIIQRDCNVARELTRMRYNRTMEELMIGATYAKHPQKFPPETARVRSYWCFMHDGDTYQDEQGRTLNQHYFVKGPFRGSRATVIVLCDALKKLLLPQSYIGSWHFVDSNPHSYVVMKDVVKNPSRSLYRCGTVLGYGVTSTKTGQSKTLRHLLKRHNNLCMLTADEDTMEALVLVLMFRFMLGISDTYSRNLLYHDGRIYSLNETTMLDEERDSLFSGGGTEGNGKSHDCLIGALAEWIQSHRGRWHQQIQQWNNMLSGHDCPQFVGKQLQKLVQESFTIV